MKTQSPTPPSTKTHSNSFKEGVKNKKPNTINEKHNEIMDVFERNEKEKIPQLLKEIHSLKQELIKLIDTSNITDTHFEIEEETNTLYTNPTQEEGQSMETLVSPTDERIAGENVSQIVDEGWGRTLLFGSPPKKRVKIVLTPHPPTNVTNVDKYIDIYEQLISKKAEIKKLKLKKKNYYLENAKCIFHYFEQKKNISAGGGNQNTDILNSFFKIKTVNNVEENIDNNEKYRVSKYIYQNYWKNVNGELLNMKNYAVAMDVCHYCNSGELIHQEEEGVLICNNTRCGKFVTHIVDGSKPFNKEPPNEISYTAYIRLNHFKEILSQFQAKETTQIPPEVIDMIRARIKKERITDLSKLNYEIMRDILRKLGLNKYFEHIQYINSIFGVKPPVMSEALIETLCVLFIEIQPKFSIYCPANRTNLLSYSYILHQLCVLLDQKQYLPYITTLKDIDKQRQNDVIWYSICKSLDWQYFPTI
jgi:hypothetical protein